MTLEEIPAFMRENKILHLKTSEFEITMHPDGFAAAGVKPTEELKQDPKFTTERGHSGQTKAEQVEYFGQWFPADFEG
jgi:hypothetical protein